MTWVATAVEQIPCGLGYTVSGFSEALRGYTHGTACIEAIHGMSMALGMVQEQTVTPEERWIIYRYLIARIVFCTLA